MARHILDIDLLEKETVDGRFKGIPADWGPAALSEIGKAGWNVLRGDVPLPAAIIKDSALRNNSRWMKDFIDRFDTEICPHGKTTMAPQLFDLQLRDGAWGITAGAVSHLHVYRRYGVDRILYANQLVDPQGIAFVLREIAQSEDFDFYCLVDTVDLVRRLGEAAVAAKTPRPLQLLLEVGSPGGRTGTRSVADALAVVDEILRFPGALALRGIEAFEGIYFSEAPEVQVTQVLDLMGRVTQIAEKCDAGSVFEGEDIILSAGGSAHFDLVAAALGAVELSLPTTVVLRSGCYLTHDSATYEKAVAAMRVRSPEVGDVSGSLLAALEVWGYVQSVPEPGLALATLGKRDISFDICLPIPLFRVCPDAPDSVMPLDDEIQVSALNDQHAYLRFESSRDLRVGDMIGFGIAHPCTTFDKWQVLFIVDDDYNVIDAIRTYF